MSKHENNVKKWFYLLIGPLLAIITFLITYFLFNKYQVSIQTSAIPALSLSILIMVISQIIKTNNEIEKSSANADKVYEAVKTYLHVIRLGTPETAIAYINSNFHLLKVVRNTSFNLDDEIEIANDRFYAKDQYTDFKSTLANNIGHSDLLWKEIGDETALQRFREIHQHAQKSKNPNNYRYKLINSAFGPQINFIILEYKKDNKKEVLFNWDFRSHEEEPEVLLSRDDTIIKMFAVHFANIWKDASDDHDTNQKE